jgi:hypothetical protein
VKGAPTLLPVETSQPAPLVTQAPSTVEMFERLAKDPAVDVDKLQRLIDMQKDILRVDAEAAFNASFVQMQPKIPTIAEKAKTDKTTYAPLEDIIEIVRPILSAHNFTLSFRTEWPEPQTVKVTGILTHQQGHSRTSEFIASADKSGSKNDIQAYGSSVSYGKRYTTKDLLCIVTRKEDDDGTKAGAADRKSPDGFGKWLEHMKGTVAKNGVQAVSAAWENSDPAFRKHIKVVDWEAIKADARQADKDRANA